MAVGHNSSPYITIYDWITGVPVKISDPATLPADDAVGCAWSPDGRYLAVAHYTSPYITIYERSGASIVKISDPATLPTGIGRDCTWSPDGRYIGVAHISSPYISIYDWRSSVTKEWLLQIFTKNGQVAGHQSELEYRFI